MVKRSKKSSSKPLKKQKFEEEEILSEEASISEAIADDFFEPTETAEEKRVRLAKQLITTLQSKASDPSEVRSHLLNTGLEVKGKLVLKRAQKLSPSYEASFFKGHLLGITCLAVYPDGSKCLTGSKDCCLIQWAIPAGKKLKIVKGFRHKKTGTAHDDEVLTVCLSDDGIYAASGGKDKVIFIWKADTFDLVSTLKGHRDSVTGLKFSQNSHTLFSCSMDRTVKVWEVDDRVNLDTLHGHYSGIHDMDCVYADRVLTCGFDCSIRLWKTAEESQLVYTGHSQSIDCIRVINIENFVTGGQDGHICTWKTGKKKPATILESPHSGDWITSLAVCKNTDIVASGSSNGFINLYEFSNSLSKVSEVRVPGYVTCLEFTRGGEFLLASVSMDHKLGRWTSSIKAKIGIYIIKL